jgi:hypothetical protein
MKFPRKESLTLLTLLLVLPLAGCATIMGGGTQLVTVSSAPSEATITADPEAGTFTTPASLQLERKFGYTLTATRDGYRPATARLTKKMRVGPLIADILLTGLIGVIVDGVTGAWYELQPAVVTLVLEQSNPLDEGPDVIEVTLSVDEEKDGLTEIRATSPVQIEVTRN